MEASSSHMDKQHSEKPEESVLQEMDVSSYKPFAEELELLKNLKSTLDTSSWSRELEENVYRHPSLKSEQERGLAKLYITLRRCYHGESVMGYFLQCAEEVDEKVGKYVRLKKGTYVNSIVSKNGMGALQANGDIILGKGQWFSLAMEVYVQLRQADYIPPEEELDRARHDEFEERLADLKKQGAPEPLIDAIRLRSLGFNAVLQGEALIEAIRFRDSCKQDANM